MLRKLCLAALLLALPAFAAPPRALTVYAAASLTDCFNALGAEWEKAHPGVKVRFNYGASSTLKTQIEQGAPADVFAAADWDTMRPLDKAKRVLSPKTFAKNRLTIVVPTSNPGEIRSPRDLDRRGLRLVTTSQAVPVGRYTQQVLEKLSKQEGYSSDYTALVNANVVSRETNVRSVLAKVELGEADGAFVYATDARGSKRVRIIPIPAAANITAEYPIASVAGSPNAPEAEAFTAFVLSKPGKAVLKRFGFQ